MFRHTHLATWPPPPILYLYELFSSSTFVSRHIHWDIGMFSCSLQECEGQEELNPPRPFWCDAFGFLIILTILVWAAVCYGYVNIQSQSGSQY